MTLRHDLDLSFNTLVAARAATGSGHLKAAWPVLGAVTVTLHLCASLSMRDGFGLAYWFCFRCCGGQSITYLAV
eukprot:1626894-Pleurochrysis_carterae.AAC.3